MKTNPTFPILCKLQRLNKCLLLSAFCLLLSAEAFAQPVTLDKTFGENGMTVIPNLGEIKLIDFDKQGNIVAMGATKIDGTDYLTIVKTNADGIVDETFGTNGKVTVLDFKFNIVGVFGLKITADNKIFITGNFDENKRVLMQFNENGSFDNTFGVNGKVIISMDNFYVYLSNLENNNFIVNIGWRWYDDDDEPIPFISKYNYEGEMDETFGNNGIVYLTNFETYKIQPRCIKTLSDQSIIIAGYDNSKPSEFEVVFCKLDQSGNFVTDFANNGIWKMNIYDDEDHEIGFSKWELFDNVIEDNYGNIILVGYITMSSTAFVCSFNPNGKINSDFGTNGFFYHNELSYYGDFMNGYVPKILLHGRKYIIGAAGSIIKISSNGTLNVSFNDNGMFTFENFTFRDMKLQRADKLILGGRSFGNSVITRLNIPSDVSIKPYSNIENSVIVYPNPTTGELRITNYELRTAAPVGASSAKLITNIEIFDVYGRKILSHASLLSSEATVNISHLPAGIYFVKITTDAGEIVKKVVKI